MIDARIVLLETKDCSIPDSYREADGTISIPISVNIDLNIKQQELTEFSKLISNFTNSFTQEVSPEDQYKLQYVHHKRNSRNTSRYRGYLIADNIKVLDGYVTVTKSEEKPTGKNTKYTFQIIGTHQQWKDGSKNLLVRDIDAQKESIIWDTPLVLDKWMNAPYTEGGDAFYPLFANFGKYLTSINTGLEGDPPPPETSEVSLGDIRILNYINPLIKQGFCQLGYEVKSRFLDSEYGRRQAGYHMGENYAKDSILSYNHMFKAHTERAENEVVSDPFGVVVLPIEDDFTPPYFDDGDTYVGYSGVIAHIYAFQNNTRGMVRYRFHYDLKFIKELPHQVQVLAIHLEALIGRIDSAALDPPIVQSPITSRFGDQEIIMQGYFDINVPSGYYVKLSWKSSVKTNYELYMGSEFIEGTWWNERLSQVFLSGDEIDVNKTIDPDLTFEDLIFDTATLFNWRFRTTESLKLVEIEPDPSSYKIWHVELEQFIALLGFQGREEDEHGYIDLTNDMNLNEWIEKDIKGQKKPENYLFRFNKHSDKYDKYEDFTEEEPPLAKNVEIGGDAKQISIALKKYEPTLNDFDEGLRAANSSAPYIPFIWGNEREDDGGEPMPSNKVGYRIFCVLGWVQQFDDITADAAKFLFEEVEHEYVPTVFQHFPNYYALFDITGTLPRRKTNLNNIFGSSEEKNDLLTSVYNRTIRGEIDEIDHYFKINMTNLKLHCWKEGMLMRLYFDNKEQELYNGFYSIREIAKTVNNREDASIRARYIASAEDCQQELPEPEAALCNIDELLPTAKLWVDASDPYADGSAVPEGTPIGTWVDKSNEQNDLIQIGAESVPVKFSTGGGYDVIEFTSDQLKTTNPIPLFTSFLFVFIVSRTRLTSGDGVTFSFHEEDGGFTYTDEWSIPDTGGNLRWKSRGDADKLTAWGGNTSDYNIFLLRTGNWNPMFPEQDLFNRNSLNLGEADSGGYFLADDFVIGRSTDGGGHQHINISELLIFNRALVETEIQCIFDYLSDKWNVPLE